MPNIRVRPKIYTFLLAMMLLLLPALEAEAQDGNAIAPQSTLKISVGRWDPVTETYTAWPDLGGEYAVGAGGVLILPMVGEISVSDMGPAELSQEIAQRLGARMGLVGQVSAAVSVSAFEPVYVTGGIQSAGAYPFRPSLTVLQAVSLAGGLKTAGSAFLRSERNALATIGEYRVLELNLLRSLARLARLEAELNNEPEIETPEEVADAPLGEELMEQERAIREAREAALESSLQQFEELEQLLKDRIERINTQLELRDRQLELAREELERTSSLVERGLSVESRRISLEQRLADQEVRRLELETAKLNAEQRLNELARDRSNLINERRQYLVQEVGSVRIELEKLRVRMETQSALYAEALRYGDGIVDLDRADIAQFEITRRTDDGVSRIDAEEDTMLRPGDVLRVELAGADMGSGSESPTSNVVDLGLPESLTGN